MIGKDWKGMPSEERIIVVKMSSESHLNGWHSRIKLWHDMKEYKTILKMGDNAFGKALGEMVTKGYLLRDSKSLYTVNPSWLYGESASFIID